MDLLSHKCNADFQTFLKDHFKNYSTKIIMIVVEFHS